MTYFSYLFIFLVLPLACAAVLTWRDAHLGRRLPAALGGYAAAWVLLAHVIVALLYTTPWDNYLVATRVWWYDPALVSGLVLGWVPVEEYTFFVLQTLFTGLVLLWLLRRSAPAPAPAAPARLRLGAGLAVASIWLFAAGLLLMDWQPGTYLGLELAWALPPIFLQVAFGADILWRYRRPILAVLIPLTLYLAATDALAIASGTWTIDPAQSLGIYLAGVLPLEEFLFFLLTNTLVVFGVTLVLARESQARAGLEKTGRLVPR